MSKNDKKAPALKQTNDLRRQAEKRIRKPMDSTGETSEIKVQKLIHELQAHQIELEMQNKALHTSQMETADERRRYENLFEFAPVGYFTLDRKGHITETNVTGASLLGAEKRSLTGPVSICYAPGTSVSSVPSSEAGG